MLNDEILKALVEGIIYIAPEPVTLDGILKVLDGEERERVKAKLEELVADYEQNVHGIQVRQVANGYKFSTKAEHHEILRKYVKSLKPPIRLSKPALETLAVIAYRQPVTMPEIEEIRGVDSGGVIHTLLEKKLVVTSGRKSVVGRPILYRTSKDFLVHFGLKDVGELPSLKEFEELAKRALGAEWATGGEGPAITSEANAAPSAEGGAPAVEAPPETPPQALLPAGEEGAASENLAAPEPVPAATEETGAVNVEAPPVCEESTPVETPVAPEPAPTAATETGAVIIQALPVGEESASAEAPVATEPLPVATEETGAVGIEALPVGEESTPVEAPVTPDPAPIATEETGAVSIEAPPAPSGESIPASGEPNSAAPPETTPLGAEELATGEHKEEVAPPPNESTEN